ncbi:MAG: biopolymer transporter ExbD [Candidatus Omnitrophica bacterium]|nr:biopolymer transporter ExbD [Candidatus Omnitrophota bacterium]
MRFRRHMEIEHGLKQIDIAPLIDIVFQLLIFFMLTSSFIIQPGIKVNLPKALTSEVVKFENVELLVSAENIVYFNGKVVVTSELKNLLAGVAKRKQSVLIRADKQASLGRIVEVWDMCRDLGVAQVNIATNQE